MAFVKCECGFMKKDIPDIHIGKSKPCPKCKKEVTVTSSVFLSEPKQETPPTPEPAPDKKPLPIPEERIINTDVLKKRLKEYKDKILTLKDNKRILIPAAIVIIVGIIAVWQTSFVKRYFFKKKIVSYLQEVLKDPDSLKIIKWGDLISIKEADRKEYPSLYKNIYWEFRVRYSGANAYGGRVSSTSSFYINSDGEVVRHSDDKD